MSKKKLVSKDGREQFNVRFLQRRSLIKLDTRGLYIKMYNQISELLLHHG